MKVSRKNFVLIPMLLVLVLFHFLGTELTAEDGQGWLNNSLTLKVNSVTSLVFTQEIRCNEVTLMDGYMHNLQAGISFKLNHGFFAGVLYKRETVQKTGYMSYENRITLQGGWKVKLNRNSAFDLRLRTEIRSFEDDAATDNVRFRLRFRYTGSLKFGKLALKPFVAFEPFGDTQADEINRYRLYAGTGIGLTRNLNWVVSYIRQGTRNKTTLNILNTGFSLKF